MMRWRGLKSLVGEAVEHGSRAVERVQIEMAKTPFDLLERIPPIALPVKGVRELHNFSVSSVHGMIRLVNRVVGDTLDVVIDVIDKTPPPDEAAAEKASEKAAAPKQAG